MADVTVKLDKAQIKALETDPGTRADILSAGLQMAAQAAAMAPKDTGAGAASIGPFPADVPGAVDVSWSQSYPYLIFQEDGTVHVPARHFLRDAFESYIHT